jgi:tripartite-type tricarboxylate transporter receptor subunit TctC
MMNMMNMMKKMGKATMLWLVFLFAMVLAASVASAADFPDKNRTITFIVGYEPGGSSDSICRVIAGYMTEVLGVPVIIENIPGAANMVALNALSSRPQDGYTVAMCAGADSPWAYAASSPANIRWTGDDFRILGRMTASPAGMGIIAKAGRWPNFAEFIKEVRSKPEKSYNHGIVGPGRPDDLQIAEIEKFCGVKFNIVHYGSSNAIQTDILTGDLDTGTIGCNRVNYVGHKNFDVLALYGKTVPDDYPVHELPLLGSFEEELGFKWEDAKYIPLENGGTSVLIRAKTDPAIVEVYKDCLRKVSQIEAYKEQIRRLSYPYMMEEEEALAQLKAVAAAVAEAAARQP